MCLASWCLRSRVRAPTGVCIFRSYDCLPLMGLHCRAIYSRVVTHLENLEIRESQGILFWRKMSGKSQGNSEKSEMSGKSQGILSNHPLQNFIKALCFWMKFHVNKLKIFRSRLRRSRPPTTITVFCPIPHLFPSKSK